MPRITDKIFREFVEIVYRESGIVLNDKRELLEARMASLCRKKGYSGPEEVLSRLKNDSSGDALIELLDQVSTNLTFFFREPAHFTFAAKKLLPDLTSEKRLKKNNRIRFWCAACSSGEEPYSLAITAKEFLGDNNSWDLKILATDISTKVLRKAIEARYSKQEVMKAPTATVQKYFERGGTREAATYQVRDEIKRMVYFRRLNLLDDGYPFKGPFDLIICRNVMIYFDNKTKQELLQRFHRYLAPGGYLFTGHAESLASYEHLFQRIQVAVYRK